MHLVCALYYDVYMQTQEPNKDSGTLSIRLPSNVKDDLGRLARATKRTRSFLAAEAVEAYVAREMEIVAGIQRGLDDMRAGRVEPHDAAMQGVRATIDQVLRNKP